MLVVEGIEGGIGVGVVDVVGVVGTIGLIAPISLIATATLRE